ncbi:methyltransferase [Pseudoalteromonas sp. Of7M-16]|uniref:spermidine synthase n=1 Tax=Pseudoalteromonas sp. Of7M-16 TaxID=2917756 RepID=UPI001EF748AB|nr:methyltransferase [Pseudoalteromonas sp. Of7M-16]MCG7548100.1 methyltransferase [Pseudoalteromonas sp. Of7M-16]
MSDSSINSTPPNVLLNTVIEQHTFEVFENDTLRWFCLDGVLQTAMSKAEPESLMFPHMLFMTIPLLEAVQVNTVLELGLGGGGLLRYLNAHNPDIQIEVVEKSAQVIEIYNQFFNPQQTDSQIHCADAYDFVQQAPKHQVDLLMVDIFASQTLVPFIFDRSFYNNLNNFLAKNGWLVINTVFTEQSHIEQLSNVLTKLYPNALIYGFKAAQFANIVWVMSCGGKKLSSVWHQQAFFTASKTQGLSYHLT